MITSVIKLLRPSQWIKNGVVLAGLIFAGKAQATGLVERALLAMIAFCLLSSTVYVLNDIIDRDRDRQHPLKKNRPIAAGKIAIPSAIMIAVPMAVAAMVICYLINSNVLIVAIAYLTLHILYTSLLKNIVIIDVMAIAAGFVLRALAGAVAIEVEFSGWLLISTFLLALFLGFGKRRHELTLLADEASGHRRILASYSPYFLDQLIGVVTASTVITYLFYTLSSEVSAKLGTDYLFVTIPFVIYGIFRYLYLVHQEERGGSPTTLLLTDWPLLFDVVLWLASIIIILYIF
ncbi:MAG: decaprenyl-phosphate phosphoribosyltransferase [candidate division Zixibacteria bacterium]|nr:decaprenyl-phosphate phosphoribosyltransferase [candidate division Zixibacteria bacterium]